MVRVCEYHTTVSRARGRPMDARVAVGESARAWMWALASARGPSVSEAKSISVGVNNMALNL